MAEVKDAILAWIKKWQDPDGKPRVKQGLPPVRPTPEELDAKQLEEEKAPTAPQSKQLQWLDKPIRPRPSR